MVVNRPVAGSYCRAPFADVTPGTYAWAHSEQIVSEIELCVADAACRLAELATESGDAATALWDCRQGILVTPSNEALYRSLMSAAHLAGDFDAIDEAFRDAGRVARVLDASDRVAPETAALYERLRSTRAQPATSVLG